MLGAENCELQLVNDPEIEGNITEEVAVVVLTHVNYKSGKLHNIERITHLAHEKGALVIWDLAHSTGVLSLEIDKWNVDFAVRDKSISLGELFLALVNEKQELSSLILSSPAQSADRGSQLAFSHPHAFDISQALIDAGIVVDFRSPDILRFGFAPLYVSHFDVYKAVQVLAEIVSKKIYLNHKYGMRQKVT
jgi:kynureninase